MLESALFMIVMLRDWQPGPHAVKSNDIAFMAAVEQSIQLEPNSKPPEPTASDIECLGAGCYEFRNDAYERLLNASVKNPRWLFWGVNHPDLEVRLWCNKALWAITECHGCRGTGVCEFSPSQWGNEVNWCTKCFELPINHQSSKPPRCRDCQGQKRFWQRAVKDNVVFPKNPPQTVKRYPWQENQEENQEGAPWGN
jgi:hypothetical protein